jgi:hypothetical protein
MNFTVEAADDLQEEKQRHDPQQSRTTLIHDETPFELKFETGIGDRAVERDAMGTSAAKPMVIEPLHFRGEGCTARRIWTQYRSPHGR